MLRTSLAFALILIPVSNGAATENILEQIRKQEVLRSLIPDAVFTPGMTVADLEQVLELKYGDWRRSDKERATNNRNDPNLSPDARAKYLQRVSIGWEDHASGTRQRYAFALTSPLGSPAVYSVAYEVTFGSQANGPIPLQAWLEAYESAWGRPHGGRVSKERTRVTYFFNSSGQLIDRGDACGPLFEMFFRLDEKMPSEVEQVVDFLDGNKCAYAVDNIIRLNESMELSKSTLYFVDFNLQANDVLKRVQFGSR